MRFVARSVGGLVRRLSILGSASALIVLKGTNSTGKMIRRCSVPLLAGGSGRREDTVVYRAGLTDEAYSFPFGSWNEINNFAHVSSY